MQERVKTSFIPKASLAVEGRRPPQNPIGLINVVASVILIAAIIGAIGLFLFEQYTVQSLNRKHDSLDRARAAFEPDTIKTLARLDTRLTVGEKLLTAHIVPSAVFDEIENITLSSVRFTDFSFSEITPGKFEISMSGVARSFNALALESDAFGASELFTNPLFEGLNLDDTGNVVFSVKAQVNGTRMLFSGTSAIETVPAETQSNEVTQ